MRGISKPWPPANVSRDGMPARSMRAAETDFLAALQAAPDKPECARNTFDDLNKIKLRDVLYVEQRYICIYCEDEVSEQRADEPRGLETGMRLRSLVPTIDHWRPLNESPELALHWKNLVLSCPHVGTCDDAKGKQRLAHEPAAPHLPWPCEARYDEWIGFTSGGEAYVRSDNRLDETTRRSLKHSIEHVLRLNHPALVKARAGAIDSEKTRLERLFRGRHASAGDRQLRATQMLGKPKYPKFISVRVAYLTKALGKHK